MPRAYADGGLRVAKPFSLTFVETKKRPPKGP